MDSFGYSDRVFNPEEVNVGGTHGFFMILYLLEHPTTAIPFVSMMISGLLGFVFNFKNSTFVLCALCVPPVAVCFFTFCLWVLSCWHSTGPAKDWDAVLEVHDSGFGRKWKGRKIPIDTLIEAYMNEKVSFKGDPLTILWKRTDFCTFQLTFGQLRFFLAKFMGQLVHHSQSADTAEVRDVYDRGNDFYNWFLGETMVYTCGLFDSEHDTLEDAQKRKMETVCKKVHMKKGDKHLDIGCGWGTLIVYAAEHFGSVSTGVTLAKEQKEWGLQQAEDHGVHVDILCMDYRDIPEQQFDKITSLEMAEHVGIKNFQKYLLQVKKMLKDDGIYYMQVAGLRRAWQFEDLIWGLFMGTYIFPAADASCPLGFVTSQCERAGFEIHSVENTGVQYALTINKWYENWVNNKDKVVEKYGMWWYRLWIIFLGWSTIIASQGSSTVFMLTMHKNTSRFERREHWVGNKPIAVQQ